MLFVITDTGIHEGIISLYVQQEAQKDTIPETSAVPRGSQDLETQDKHLSLSLPSDSYGWQSNLKNHISAVTIMCINQAHKNKAKHL